MLCHLVAKFATKASGAIWWSNLVPCCNLITESISGSVVPLAMFHTWGLLMRLWVVSSNNMKISNRFDKAYIDKLMVEYER